MTKEKTSLGDFSLVNSCSCMQMLANALPSGDLTQHENSQHCSIQEALAVCVGGRRQGVKRG